MAVLVEVKNLTVSYDGDKVLDGVSLSIEEGETFVIVSHNIDFVRMICDRVAYMKGGKIVSMGKPEEVKPLITEGMT